MPRYLFIGVFCLGLFAAAVLVRSKTAGIHNRTDELTQGLLPLKDKLPQDGRLSCYLADKSLTEGLIRGRFILVPLVLIPVTACKPGDTVLVIRKPPIPADTAGQTLWSWSDTAICYSLIRITH